MNSVHDRTYLGELTDLLSDFRNYYIEIVALRLRVEGQMKIEDEAEMIATMADELKEIDEAAAEQLKAYLLDTLELLNHRPRRLKPSYLQDVLVQVLPPQLSTAVRKSYRASLKGRPPDVDDPAFD